MLEQPPVWLILLAFVCAIGPLVFIHELGHYFVARLFGVGAEVFSIGFGREIVGWTDKRQTRWKVCWLPLGGYVRFVGDMNPASSAASENLPEAQRARSFHHKPVWQRFLIVLAGPMANFALAILIFAAFFALVGAPRTNIVGEVQPNTAAAEVGIQPGDRILSVAGRQTPTFTDLLNVVGVRPNENVTVELERGGAVREVRVTLRTDVMRDSYGQETKRGLLGVRPAAQALEPVPVAQALPEAFSYTLRLTRAIVDGIGQIISGAISPKQIGGPIKIAQIAGEGVSLGPLAFVQLIALLSINLGFINLLPVPLLDGGHLFFYAIEAARRRPVSAKAQEWAFRGGLALILALLVFTTVNDLDSFGLWDGLERLIG
jgi:regulator of sigma E protease